MNDVTRLNHAGVKKKIGPSQVLAEDEYPIFSGRYQCAAKRIGTTNESSLSAISAGGRGSGAARLIKSSAAASRRGPGALYDPAAHQVAKPINAEGEIDHTLDAAGLRRILLKARQAHGPGCPGSQRALRLCGRCAAEGAAVAIGTSTANWRGTFNPPSVRNLRRLLVGRNRSWRARAMTTSRFEKCSTLRRSAALWTGASLMYAALDAVAFAPVRHAPRVLLFEPRHESVRQHMFVTITIGGATYVIDPGFGPFACPVPIPIDGTPVPTSAPTHRN